MMYHVGDFIRLKSWERMVQEYGHGDDTWPNPRFGVAEEMQQYFGRDFQIESVTCYDDIGDYRLVGAGRFHYSTDMIEGLVSDIVDEECDNYVFDLENFSMIMDYRSR